MSFLDAFPLLAGTIIVALLLFLALRAVALWYWRVNDGLALLREQAAATRDAAQAARETRDAVRALTEAVTQSEAVNEHPAPTSRS